MIEIRIPKEIREYKEKIFLGMTVRQIICNTCAIAVCVPTYIYGKEYLGKELISWLVIILGLCIGMMGYYNYNGMTFEKFLVAVYKFYTYPIKRKYISINPLDRAIDAEYKELLDELNEEKKKDAKGFLKFK